jgi:hypothetical protein
VGNSEVMPPEIPKDNRGSFTAFRMTWFWGSGCAADKALWLYGGQLGSFAPCMQPSWTGICANLC